MQATFAGKDFIVSAYTSCSFKNGKYIRELISLFGSLSIWIANNLRLWLIESDSDRTQSGAESGWLVGHMVDIIWTSTFNKLFMFGIPKGNIQFYKSTD